MAGLSATTRLRDYPCQCCSAEIVMGRPQREFTQKDIEMLEMYAQVGASNVEIAAALGCDESIIRRRFAENLAKARSRLKHTLRKAQIKKALSGNVGMLIWLGKQMLGQSDKVTQVTLETDSESDLARRILNDDDARHLAADLARIVIDRASSDGGISESEMDLGETSGSDLSENLGRGLPVTPDKTGEEAGGGASAENGQEPAL